jgi:hypothetical protein
MNGGTTDLVAALCQAIARRRQARLDCAQLLSIGRFCREAGNKASTATCVRLALETHRTAVRAGIEATVLEQQLKETLYVREAV